MTHSERQTLQRAGETIPPTGGIPGKFQLDSAGKLNIYIARVDDRLRQDPHADTVGILRQQEWPHRRYSLGRATSSMAVACYTYDALPIEVRNDLPDADLLTSSLPPMLWALRLKVPPAVSPARGRDRRSRPLRT
jgi:hypothetical protein